MGSVDTFIGHAEKLAVIMSLLDPLTIKHSIDFRNHRLFKQWTFTTRLTTLFMEVLHSYMFKLLACIYVNHILKCAHSLQLFQYP